MRFFQVPARPWWSALIALVVYVACYVGVLYAVAYIMVAADPGAIQDNDLVTTPTIFLVNNLGIATDIGLCTLIAWLFFRQGFGWLVSVVGRFRWKWMGITLGIFAIGYAVEMSVEIFIYGPSGYGLGDLEMKPYTWFMIVAILLTTPLQCAGEEFQSRALLPRLIAAIVPFKWPGLVLSALVPSAVFMYLHAAEDPWLNINYFCVALLMWWLAYRTGGIEASIALHFINNFFSEWYMPFTNFADMFDRSEGTGSPAVMIYVGVELVLVLFVDWVARRKGVVRMSAPAAQVPAVVRPHRWFTPYSASIARATKKDLPRIEKTVRETPTVAPVLPGGFPGSIPAEPVGYPVAPGVYPAAPAVYPTAYGSVPLPDPFAPAPTWPPTPATVPPAPTLAPMPSPAPMVPPQPPASTPMVAPTWPPPAPMVPPQSPSDPTIPPSDPTQVPPPRRAWTEDSPPPWVQ